jgi:hypothetical protein
MTAASVALPHLLIPPASPDLAVLQLARLRLRVETVACTTADDDDSVRQPVGCASCGALMSSTNYTDDGSPSKRRRKTTRPGSRTTGSSSRPEECIVCGKSPLPKAGKRIEPCAAVRRPRTRRSTTSTTDVPDPSTLLPALEPPTDPPTTPRKPSATAANSRSPGPSALLSPSLIHVPLSEPETPSVAPPPSPPAPAQMTSQGAAGGKGKGHGQGKKGARGKRRSPLGKVLAVGEMLPAADAPTAARETLDTAGPLGLTSNGRRVKAAKDRRRPR